MTALPALLWKEWRDHRAPLVAFPFAIAPVIALGVSLLPEGRGREAALTFATFCAFAVAVLTLVADLFPGEQQRGTIELLRRLPAGLGRVFLAKLAFALAAALALSAVGYVVFSVVSALILGGPWFPALDLGFLAWTRRSPSNHGSFRWLPPALLLAAWILPVSTWLPRAALALPATAVALVVVVAPIELAVFAHPGMVQSRGDLLAFWMLLFAAAPLVAGISFVRGRRHGGRLIKSLGCGLVATLLAFAPAYARSAWLVARWNRLDPNDPTFQIDGARNSSFLGSGGHYAFLTARHGAFRAPSHAIVVDLADGSWRELGLAGDQVAPVGVATRSVAVPFVARLPTSAFERSYRDWWQARAPLGHWIDLDAVTLETKATAWGKGLPDPFRSTEEGSQFERASNSLRLPDGRRVWQSHGRLVIEEDGGGVRVLSDSRLERGSFVVPLGHGMSGFGMRRNVVYDTVRERRFELPQTLRAEWIRPGRSIVRHGVAARARGELALYEPETGELSPLPEAIEKSHFPALLDDGRLLALIPDPSDSSVRTPTFVEPERGEVERVELPAWLDGRLAIVGISGLTPRGALVAKLWSVRRDGTHQLECFAQLDVAAHRFVASCRRAATGGAGHAPDELLGCPDDETAVLIEEGRRLIRVRFGDEGAEPLFPR